LIAFDTGSAAMMRNQHRSGVMKPMTALSSQDDAVTR
jgi:hypothetical protein